MKPKMYQQITIVGKRTLFCPVCLDNFVYGGRGTTYTETPNSAMSGNFTHVSFPEMLKRHYYENCGLTVRACIGLDYTVPKVIDIPR